MKYISYILIFIVAVVVVIFAFRTLTGPGSLTEDFDLRSSSPFNEGGLDRLRGGQGEESEIELTPSTPDVTGDITPPSPPLVRGGEEEIMITGGVKHIVPLDKIISGGPPKDGIPSINDPQFVSVAEASAYLEDDKLGIAVEKDGDWRFYPFQILVWHEIVNDTFKSEPLLITYCPLCLTGIVFTPLVEGEAVEFGTSGRLFNSNLVMYDRKTDTLWSQQGGKAIAGKLAGKRLKLRSADNVFWGEFKAAHPDAQVLSQDTGFSRDYMRDPYGDYYTTVGTFFPVENGDDRLFSKAIIYGLTINPPASPDDSASGGHGSQTKAYSAEAIKRDKIVHDTFAGTDLVIVVEPETQAIRFFDRRVGNDLKPFLAEEREQGEVLTFELRDNKLFDQETGTEWDFSGQAVAGELKGEQLDRLNSEFGFWFAWVAFNPETELYD